MDLISSNIQTLDNVYVRVASFPRSFVAKAINYCYIYEENGKTHTIYSQFLRNKENEIMKLKDIIEKKPNNIKLEIDDDLILLTKKPKLDNDNIYIICNTNDGLKAIPKKEVTLVEGQAPEGTD